MDVNTVLISEHAVLYQLMSLSKSVVRSEVSLAEKKKNIKQLSKCLGEHARLEDEVLMPFIMSAPFADIMFDEHKIVHASFQKILHSKTHVEIRRDVTKLFKFIVKHFRMEEKILIPYCRKHMSVKDRVKAGKKWLKQRDVIVA